MENDIISREGISKSFFGAKVLHQVSLKVKKGSVHALIGENGAGKSTLRNILSGVYTRDEGSIRIDGVEVQNRTIQKAQNLGIAFVHQEISLFNDLRAYENIFLNNEIHKGPLIDKKTRIEKSNVLFKSLGVDIRANDFVRNLSTAQKQLLQICRSLSTNSQILILDEPTTALSNEEIDNFFRIIKMLQEQGKTFIFISHKRPEIFRICDSYTVLRNGHFIGSGRIKDATPERLAKEIVGPTYTRASFYQPRPLGEEVIRLENYSGKGFRNVSLSVRKGEIIGFTGLQGAGASELRQTRFGLRKSSSGSFLGNGENLTNLDTEKIRRYHVGRVPSNRKENSIFPALDILNNFYLASFSLGNSPLVSKKKEVDSYSQFKKDLNLKAESYLSPIISLSGGNQQKVILARWLHTDADILLLDNPTQGIDVGAKDEIYHLLLKLANQGKTIIFHTLELGEIRKCADRCLVFYHGTIAADLKREEINDTTVRLYETGVKTNYPEKENQL